MPSPLYPEVGNSILLWPGDWYIIFCKVSTVVVWRDNWSIQFFFTTLHEVPWVSCQIRKISGCACAGNAGIVNPRWWENRSRHSRRMRNPQFNVSDKRAIDSYCRSSKCNYFRSPEITTCPLLFIFFHMMLVRSYYTSS